MRLSNTLVIVGIILVFVAIGLWIVNVHNLFDLSNPSPQMAFWGCIAALLMGCMGISMEAAAVVLQLKR